MKNLNYFCFYLKFYLITYNILKKINYIKKYYSYNLYDY